jgi:hypothetical protein
MTCRAMCARPYPLAGAPALGADEESAEVGEGAGGSGGGDAGLRRRARRGDRPDGGERPATG